MTTLNLTTVNDAGAAVPFASYVVRTSAAGVVTASGATNGSGTASISLTDGAYTVSVTKSDYAFNDATVDVATPGPAALSVIGTAQSGRYISSSDLDTCADPALIDRLFNDDNSGVRNPMLIAKKVSEAEALAENMLLRSWTRDQIATLARNDPALRVHIAWVALELASERRSEFIAADGKGRFWAQYERAVAYFDQLSKGKNKSRGEAVAGNGANTGGAARPVLETDQSRFIFADESDGTQHGGF